MKIRLLLVDRTDNDELKVLIERYSDRIVHYVPFETVVVPKPKNASKLPRNKQKEAEGMAILKELSKNDHVIILDELGKEFTSVGFSQLLEKRMIAATKQLVFVIGGAFGFSSDVYARADSKMALSKMTFTHQMIRLLFVEQLYRACTIIRGESYHH